jgi:hypothetical protein
LATLRFQQDHIISQKHGGQTALANLAWSCADCNAHKGPDLAGIDPETGKLERLFKPRVDVWEEHFRWDGAELVGKTAVGRVTVKVLQVNLEERVAVRRELMAARLFRVP